MLQNVSPRLRILARRCVEAGRALPGPCSIQRAADLRERLRGHRAERAARAAGGAAYLWPALFALRRARRGHELGGCREAGELGGAARTEHEGKREGGVARRPWEAGGGNGGGGGGWYTGR